MQRGGEVARGFSEGFTLRDDRVDGFEEGLELILEGVEVDLAIVEPVIVFDKLAACATANAKRFQHAAASGAAVAHAEGLFVFAVLDVHIEGVAFKKNLEVTVVLEDGMGGGFIEHTLEGCAAGFDEIGVEAADGLFLGRWRDDDSRVATMEGLVQPKEVAVAAGDGELWLLVCF